MYKSKKPSRLINCVEEGYVRKTLQQRSVQNMAHVTFYVAKTFILLHLFPKDLHNSHIHETLSLDVGLDIPLVAGVCLSHKVIPTLNTSLCSLQFTRQAFCCQCHLWHLAGHETRKPKEALCDQNCATTKNRQCPWDAQWKRLIEKMCYLRGV